MASFPIDRHSPIRSGVASTLRHRSRHSESENCAGETQSASTEIDDSPQEGRQNGSNGDVVQETQVADNNSLEKQKDKSKN